MLLLLLVLLLCVVFHYEIKQPALQQQLISLDKNKLHKYLRHSNMAKTCALWLANLGVGGSRKVMAQGKGHGHEVSYECISQISICFAVKQTV